MPDASTQDAAFLKEIDRVFWCRKRAVVHRQLAASNKRRGGTSWAGWLDAARQFDAQADEILAAMRRGETAPLFDLTRPYRG